MPPGPLRDRFPNGFDDLANALFPYVFTHPEHRDWIPRSPSRARWPSCSASRSTTTCWSTWSASCGIIDALGGVTVNLSTNVHLVPNIDGQTKEAPSVGPGPVTMNGAMALSFVRTREEDSDYSRMKRQRCLLAAVAAGTSPTDLAVNYLGLASAVEGAFRSDIPREQSGRPGAGVRHGRRRRARTLVLVPPVIKPANPDVGPHPHAGREHAGRRRAPADPGHRRSHLLIGSGRLSVGAPARPRAAVQ